MPQLGSFDLSSSNFQNSKLNQVQNRRQGDGQSSTISPRHPKRSASCSRCIAAKVEPWLAVNGWAGEWRCLGAPVGK